MMAKHTPTDDLRDLRAILARGLDLDANERLVMARLILHRNGDTGQCNPSVPGLADECGISRWTVMRAVASLEAAGWLTCSRRNGRRTSYTLHPQSGSKVQPVAESNGLQAATGPVAESNGTSSTQPPERTRERTTERTDAVSDLWSIYTAEMDAGRMTLNNHRRKLLRLLHSEQLKDEPDPLRLFRAIMAAVRADDFIMQKRSFQEPDSLFRNESKRERWANAGRDRLNGRAGGKGSNPLLMSAAEVQALEGR